MVLHRLVAWLMFWVSLISGVVSLVTAYLGTVISVESGIPGIYFMISIIYGLGSIFFYMVSRDLER